MVTIIKILIYLTSVFSLEHVFIKKFSSTGILVRIKTELITKRAYVIHIECWIYRLLLTNRPEIYITIKEKHRSREDWNLREQLCAKHTYTPNDHGNARERAAIIGHDPVSSEKRYRLDYVPLIRQNNELSSPRVLN